MNVNSKGRSRPRTKTLLLSALLGALGGVAVQAQTNVYSLNAVGYISETLYPGYNLVTCPLIAAPDNTINTLFNNSSGIFNGDSIYIFQNGVGYSLITQGRAGAWTSGGATNTLSPGQAVFFYNHRTTNLTNIFLGTVPSGSVTNTLLPGYNLVGSAIPTSGNLYSNSISALSNTAGNAGDLIYTFNPQLQTYDFIYKLILFGGGPAWKTSAGGDPSLYFGPGEGFFYFNNTANSASIFWVENYSIAQ